MSYQAVFLSKWSPYIFAKGQLAHWDTFETMANCTTADCLSFLKQTLFVGTHKNEKKNKVKKHTEQFHEYFDKCFLFYALKTAAWKLCQNVMLKK